PNHPEGTRERGGRSAGRRRTSWFAERSKPVPASLRSLPSLIPNPWSLIPSPYFPQLPRQLGVADVLVGMDGRVEQDGPAVHRAAAGMNVVLLKIVGRQAGHPCVEVA